jgi:hypothetical protein
VLHLFEFLFETIKLGQNISYSPDLGICILDGSSCAVAGSVYRLLGGSFELTKSKLGQWWIRLVEGGESHSVYSRLNGAHEIVNVKVQVLQTVGV